MSRYVSKKLRFAVLQRDGFVCRYCGAKNVPLHIDHVHPYSKGGKTEFDNLAAACWECNIGKGAKTIEGEMDEEINQEGFTRPVRVDDDQTHVLVDYGTEWIYFLSKDDKGPTYALYVLGGTNLVRIANIVDSEWAERILSFFKEQTLQQLDMTFAPGTSPFGTAPDEIDDIPFPKDPVEA